MLTSGLGEATSVCPSVRDTLLVGSSTGLWEVNGEGASARLWKGRVDAVSAHVPTIYVLSEARVKAGPWTPAGTDWVPSTELDATGAHDLLAWCDGLVLLAEDQGVEAWDPATGQRWLWAHDLPAVRALALTADCGGALAVAADSVWLASPKGSRALVTGLTDARAAATDKAGRVWVAQGADTELGRVEDGVYHTFARYLGAARDLHFGLDAPLLPSDAVYIADGEGTLDYVRLTGG